jgi:hypothetical protein
MRTIDVILLAIGATGSEDQEKRSFAFASSAEIVRVATRALGEFSVEFKQSRAIAVKKLGEAW